VARKLKVPILEGTDEPVSDRKEAIAAAKKIGFPLIIKAAFGGGGRGMRVVREAKDLEKLLDEAQTEALRAFGNGAVFLESSSARRSTSKCRSSPINTATCCICMSATAPCSVVIRRSSSRRRAMA
jgi:biotin carboxylase